MSFAHCHRLMIYVRVDESQKLIIIVDNILAKNKDIMRNGHKKEFSKDFSLIF